MQTDRLFLRPSSLGYANMTIKGFGVTARSTAETRRLEPTGITVFRQADVGEYLREVTHGCGGVNLGHVLTRYRRTPFSQRHED